MVRKLVAPGQYEEVSITKDQQKEIKRIVEEELNIQPFGTDKEEGPDADDYLGTIQYNLNHATVEKLGLSSEAIKFIKESGLFLE